jgi:hypothetical protein
MHDEQIVLDKVTHETPPSNAKMSRAWVEIS